jgi:EAL and modified HD-GYP domain-containing signal transduction protein
MHGVAMDDVFIGRQPVYDRNLDVAAYELLFRSGTANQAAVKDGNRATSEVFLNAMIEFGLDSLAGDRPVLVNVTRKFIVDNLLPPLDKGRFILEILEDIEPDEEFVAAMQRVAAAGYRIALDDFEFADKYLPMVKLAEIVKLDVRGLGLERLEQDAKILRRVGVKQLLAEKVETLDEFEHCKRLGFDLFQGYFLSKPRVLTGKTVRSQRLSTLQVLTALRKPDVGFEQLETIIGRDVTLTYKLLRYVNSASTGVRKKVESIRQAVSLLGLERLRTMVTLLTLSEMKDKPAEMVHIALTRAKTCELLGQALNRKDCESFYIVGLFSMLDALLDAPLETVVQSLPLCDDVRVALLDREGAMGHALNCALAMERPGADDVRLLGLSAAQIQHAYLEALGAARESQAELRQMGHASANDENAAKIPAPKVAGRPVKV